MFLYDIIDPITKLLGDKGYILSDITFVSILLRIILAILMSGLIGLERASKKHAAGLRTYILTCLGSTMAAIADQYCSILFTSDGSRLGAAVISGIGFLGAGTILLTSKGQIKGLTTAAGIWTSACLGLCIGFGLYTVALIAFICIILVFTFLPKIERAYTANRGCFEIHIEFETRANLKSFVSLVREQGLDVVSVEHNAAYSNSGLSVYTIVLAMTKTCKFKKHIQCMESFKELPYVVFVEEI
jgi:putative Mg2+ transporter-C (MgtC) family protein